MSSERITDLTKGIYRRIYGGFVGGKRINSVSIYAESWFWRLQAIADDFGNFGPGLKMVRSTASPVREVTVKQVEGWMMELEHAGLITKYASGGDDYWNIVGFCAFQPAGKNGRRVQRFPLNGESGQIQGDPAKPIPIQSEHQHQHQHSHQHQHQQAGGAGGAANFAERVKALTTRPEWWQGKPWIDDDTARELAGLYVDDATIAAAIKLAQRKRKREGNQRGIDNPPGFIISEIRKAAAMNGSRG